MVVLENMRFSKDGSIALDGVSLLKIWERRRMVLKVSERWLWGGWVEG